MNTSHSKPFRINDVTERLDPITRNEAFDDQVTDYYEDADLIANKFARPVDVPNRFPTITEGIKPPEVVADDWADEPHLYLSDASAAARPRYTAMQLRVAALAAFLCGAAIAVVLLFGLSKVGVLSATEPTRRTADPGALPAVESAVPTPATTDAVPVPAVEPPPVVEPLPAEDPAPVIDAAGAADVVPNPVPALAAVGTQIVDPTAAVKTTSAAGTSALQATPIEIPVVDVSPNAAPEDEDFEAVLLADDTTPASEVKKAADEAAAARRAAAKKAAAKKAAAKKAAAKKAAAKKVAAKKAAARKIARAKKATAAPAVRIRRIDHDDARASSKPAAPRFQVRKID